MADVGIKISKKNKSVLEASDKELIASSSWNNLRIHDFYELTFNDNLAGGNVTDIATHGLGYFPAFDVQFKVGSNYVTAPQLITKGVSVNQTKIQWLSSGDFLGTITIRVLVFKNSIEATQDYPIVALGDTTDTTTNNVGIKGSLNGVNILTATETQLAFSSSLSQFQILSIKNEPIEHDGDANTWFFDIDFLPYVITYTKFTGYIGYRMMRRADDVYVYITQSTPPAPSRTDVTLSTGFDGQCAAIILRNPLT